ncbi:hypothetical protein HOK51_07445 [Candidatus Woesearchaeota archaeon]|jgi:hypothetical protein|nr:hypothetical protein [Candidatus Woesearchaeota archaeon]MBT6519657.1 hypothetical protein [Candidatus Woesearchaeota archaeon]MBT7368697.1 hypothetical protein [Candidatus Woesearchaeota archaeon]
MNNNNNNNNNYGIKNLEGILSMYLLMEQTEPVLSKLRRGVKKIDTKELECAKKIIEKGTDYVQLVSELQKLGNTAFKLRRDLMYSLDRASRIAQAPQSNMDGKKGILDIIESKQIWVQESLNQHIEIINSSVEDVPGSKLQSGTGSVLIRLNSAINEFYTNTNLFHLHEAASVIGDTSYELVNELNARSKNKKNNSITINYITSLTELQRVAEGNKGVKYKINKRSLIVKRAKPIYNKK